MQQMQQKKNTIISVHIQQVTQVHFRLTLVGPSYPHSVQVCSNGFLCARNLSATSLTTESFVKNESPLTSVCSMGEY
jgi:hypothetical protein